MGWAHGSKMVKVYVHLNDDDVDNAILRVYGIEKQVDKERNVTYVPKVCPRCKEQNSNASQYCYKCGMPLDQKALDELIENQKKIQNRLHDMGSTIPQIQVLLDMMPESEKTGILASIVELSLREKDKSEMRG